MPTTKPVRETPTGSFSCSLTLPDDVRRRSPVTEYDHLADLYDLEYAHDYDLPFWLSLAEREAGPVIEWGAGTGRIAVPLATAGHDVTAVEISAEMVERGKEKSRPLNWIVGDMRSVHLGRRLRARRLRLQLVPVPTEHRRRAGVPAQCPRTPRARRPARHRGLRVLAGGAGARRPGAAPRLYP